MAEAELYSAKSQYWLITGLAASSLVVRMGFGSYLGQVSIRRAQPTARNRCLKEYTGNMCPSRISLNPRFLFLTRIKLLDSATAAAAAQNMLYWCDAHKVTADGWRPPPPPPRIIGST